MTELMKVSDSVVKLISASAQAVQLPMLAVDSNGETVLFYGDAGDRKSCNVLRLLIKNVMLKECQIVISPLSRENCIGCPHLENCSGLAAVGHPIVRISTNIGALAVLSFCSEQMARIEADAGIFKDFLKCQSQSISNKIALNMSETLIENGYPNRYNSQNMVQFIGISQAVNEMLLRAKKAAATDSTVLIWGESGTGKEVVAKLIHAQSNRSDYPLVSINCAAIPENLVESELFGYEDGAFTGAKRSGYMGKFEHANHGTLFLDEIGDMPMSMQTKLLRVLQEQKIERLGGKHPIPIDVRVICATNKDLPKMIEQGQFRQDLYYRINILPIEILPLRQRKEDIRVLIDFFIDHYNRKMRKNIVRMDADVWKALYNYAWPGNVRELKNIIEYLENVVESETITIHDLPDHLFMKPNNFIAEKPLNEIMEAYEYRILSFMVKQTKSALDRERLAAHLKISRATLYRKIKEYELL